MKKNNFGVRGWILIVACIMLSYVSIITTVGLNVIVPKFSEIYGWNVNEMMSFSKYAGFITAIFCIAFAIIISKFEVAKVLTLITTIATLIAFILMGQVKEISQFHFLYIVLFVGIAGASCYGMPILLGNWFPKKKGIVFGMVTIGSNVGTMTLPLLLSLCWEKLGAKLGFMIFSIVIMIPILLIAFFIKSKPEYQGCYPDNDNTVKIEDTEKEKKKENIIVKTSPFTFLKLLKTKQLWSIVIGNSLIQIIYMGVVSNVYIVNESFGNSPLRAIGFLSIGSIIAIPSSIILGVIDTKFGSKIASVIVSVVCTIALIISMFHGQPWVLIPGTMAFGFFIGAFNNIVCSMTISVFGRYDFKNAISLVQILLSIVRPIGIAIMSEGYVLTGNYDTGLRIFLCLSILAVIVMVAIDEKCIGRTDADIEKIMAKYEV